MEKIVLLAVLICPVMMGVMMLLMRRGMRGGGHADRLPARKREGRHQDDRNG